MLPASLCVGCIWSRTFISFHEHENRTLLIVIVILVILSRELFLRGGLELCIVAGGTYMDITRLMDKYFVA